MIWSLASTLAFMNLTQASWTWSAIKKCFLKQQKSWLRCYTREISFSPGDAVLRVWLRDCRVLICLYRKTKALQTSHAPRGALPFLIHVLPEKLVQLPEGEFHWRLAERRPRRSPPSHRKPSRVGPLREQCLPPNPGSSTRRHIVPAVKAALAWLQPCPGVSSQLPGEHLAILT